MTTFTEDLKRLLNIRPMTDTEAREYEAKREQQLRDKFHENCGMDSQYFNATIDSNIFSENDKKQILNFIENINKGLFLMLFGTVGTGKTYTACAIMNSLLCGTFYDMPELELKLDTASRYGASENREMLLHRLANCRLLVLDEVGRFAGNNIEEQKVLFYLLNKRYANNRPTIICSNLTPSAFPTYIGEALTDRLKGRNIKLIFNGESLRRKQ